jgi:alginate O-acetyltransferase complex protein AlgI
VKLGQNPRQPLSAFWKAASVLLTFVAVTVAWAFFRAKDLPAAQVMVAGMFGWNGIGLSQSFLRDFGGAGAWLVAHGLGAPNVVDNFLVNSSTFGWIAVLMLVTWIAPNTHQLMNRYERVTNVPNIAGERPPWLAWTPTVAAAALTCVIALAAIVNLNARSAFLYFQF